MVTQTPVSQLRAGRAHESLYHQAEHDYAGQWHVRGERELRERSKNRRGTWWIEGKEILLSFEKDIVRGKRNCIVDIKYTMLPTVEFVGEIKRANSRAQKLDQILSSKSDSWSLYT